MRMQPKITKPVPHLLFRLISVSLGQLSIQEVARGNPCSQLIEEVVRYGAEAIAEKEFSRDDGEYPLNFGASLKLFWQWVMVSPTTEQLEVQVGGEGTKDYPETVKRFREIINGCPPIRRRVDAV